MTSPSPVDFSKINISTLPGGLPEKPTPNSLWSSNPLFSYLNNVHSTISSHRQSLNLANPGTMENINKEVSRDVFVSQYFFTGLRADLNKAFTMNPVFQTSHTLSIGSEQIPPYAFSALYANDNSFFQGNVDNDLSLSGRISYGWDKHNVSKLTLQLANAQPAMCQMEQDYQGTDFSVNMKALNPSFLDGQFTGVAVASILQSVTQKLALGVETVYSAQPGAPADAATSYVARYNAGNWIASGQVQGNGSVIGSFWRKVAENVEAGLETTLAMGMKPIMDPMSGMPVAIQPVFEGSTAIGAKYEYRTSVFRGQLDNAGKVSCFMEKRILPTISVLFSGELDHAKNTQRIGLGMQFEAAGNETLMMMQQGLVDQNGNPVPGVAAV